MQTHQGLRPMIYRLWLPHVGTYVRGAERNNSRIIEAPNRAGAMQLPERQAIAMARALIRGTGQTIELRPVDREEGEPAGVMG